MYMIKDVYFLRLNCSVM